MLAMQRVLTHRWTGLIALAGLTVYRCSSPKTEMKEEMLQRALNNQELPDPAALVLIAQASFRDFKEGSTMPPLKGKIPTVVIVQVKELVPLDELISGPLSDSDPRSIRRKLKAAQFVRLFTELDQFLEHAPRRNLGDLMLTLQLPSSPESGPWKWGDAYQLRLPAKNFDRYLKTASLQPDQRLTLAERLWKLDLDNLGE
jgi:hypothetical protein